MRKNLLTLIALVLGLMQVRAADAPVISSGEQVTWYLVQFLNGDGVLAAQGDGENVATAVPTGNASQLWKIEGDDTQGYTFTNKNGLMLYTTTTALNGMFQAGSAPSANTRFVWQTTTNTTYSDGWVISPQANTSVYMNQWGGSGIGKELGLWNDRTDGNQPLKFVAADDFLSDEKPLPLIPYPANLTRGDGSLAVSSLTGIRYVDEPTLRYATEFAERLRAVSGISLQTSSSAEALGIGMTVDATLAHEAYTLTVDGDGVRITAADSTGFFYAIQTLKQLLPAAIYGQTEDAAADWSLPYVTIADQPALGHRGYMLDVARHFFSKAEVKRVLDVLASYKMNRFHWHLTDDQGWRIYIPEYPKLTEVGSIRSGSLVHAGGADTFYDDTEYGRGMWFTLDDLREVVAYAKERNIEIIPEIDLPGHMVAALAAYPELSCDPTRTYSVRIDGGISSDVLNVGDDAVIDFLKCVLGHVAEVFPYQYIHIGGDECPTDVWEDNADCLQRVADEGLSGVEELQSWLVEQLGTYLKETYGKDIVVWDELLSNWSADNAVQPVIMAWNNISKTADAAAKGFKSIVVPHQSLYFDMMQVSADEADVNEKYQGGWSDDKVITVQTVYNVNPLSSLSGLEEYCMGVQGNMWTETCNDSIEMEYQMLPRLLALSETGWKPAADKDWISFYQRLQSHDDVLDAMGFTYAKHFFEEDEQTDAEKALAEASEILENSKPGEAGYPSQTDYAALNSAYGDLKADAEDADKLASLTAAIAAYKSAAITQPEEGKTYQLVSASSYYKNKYIGSTAYVKDATVHFHYTPQVEPEELWQFVKQGDGYVMQSVLNGLQVQMPDANGSNVTLESAGTALRIDAATEASGDYTYVPGAVTVSAVDGYSTDDVRRLNADASGYVKAAADAALCKPGTWYLEEVTDFTAQLRGLLDKCEGFVRDAKPGEAGEPSQDAIDYLTQNLITPATQAVADGGVTEAVYKEYVAVYQVYLEMTVQTVADMLDENYYYQIRNAYFTSYYAAATTGGSVSSTTLTTGDDAFRWRFEKNANGTVRIYSKLTGNAAYPATDSDAAQIRTGRDYAWTLDEYTIDEGATGIRIMTSSGTYTWYTNPNAWANVICKPITWGAGIWTLEKLNIETGIEKVPSAKEEVPVRYYDLQGRRVYAPVRGVYITNKGGKVLKP